MKKTLFTTLSTLSACLLPGASAFAATSLTFGPGLTDLQLLPNTAGQTVDLFLSSDDSPLTAGANLQLMVAAGGPAVDFGSLSGTIYDGGALLADEDASPLGLDLGLLGPLPPTTPINNTGTQRLGTLTFDTTGLAAGGTFALDFSDTTLFDETGTLINFSLVGGASVSVPSPPPVPGQELILNGGFEINADGVSGRNGIGAPNPTNVELPASLEDWTVSGQALRWPDGVQGLFGVVDIGDSPGDGEVVFNFGGLASVSQDITTTVGQEYIISYDLGALGGPNSPDPNGFVADINVLADGVLVDTQSVAQDAEGTNLDWTSYTVSFVATDTVTTITFEETDDVAPDDYGAILDNISVVAAFDPADLDLDGDVDDADFALFFAAFSGPGVPTGNPAADLDNDGDTDDADFGLAFAAFTGPGGAASVPEPAGLVVLGMGLLTLASRRRPD